MVSHKLLQILDNNATALTSQNFFKIHAGSTPMGHTVALILDNELTDYSRVCNNGQTCSTDCRNLLTRARNQLDCCINVFNNTDPIRVPQYAYSLWSGCDVEPVTHECQPSTVNLPPVQLDPTCDDAAGAERAVSLLCRREFVESIRERLSATAGCQDYVYPSSTACSVNRKGVYCAVLLDSNNENFTVASTSCRNTST